MFEYALSRILIEVVFIPLVLIQSLAHVRCLILSTDISGFRWSRVFLVLQIKDVDRSWFDLYLIRLIHLAITHNLQDWVVIRHRAN